MPGGRPRKTTDGLSITGEEAETTESQTETEEDSPQEQTSSPIEPGGVYKGFHSDVILDGGDYQINKGLLGHRIRVEYNGEEIFNETSFDETGLYDTAVKAVKRHKAENFPDNEEEFDLG